MRFLPVFPGKTCNVFLFLSSKKKKRVSGTFSDFELRFLEHLSLFPWALFRRPLWIFVLEARRILGKE